MVDEAAAPAPAFVGVGANLGEAVATVTAALADLAAAPGIHLLAHSSLYRTAPVQAAGPDYVNAVALIETRLAPLATLKALQAIEARHRRERPRRHAPRTLDLDLLTHGDSSLQSAELVLPHPRLHLRAFVLVPLLELQPEFSLPEWGRLADRLPDLRGQPVQRLDVRASR